MSIPIIRRLPVGIGAYASQEMLIQGHCHLRAELPALLDNEAVVRTVQGEGLAVVETDHHHTHFGFDFIQVVLVEELGERVRTLEVEEETEEVYCLEVLIISIILFFLLPVQFLGQLRECFLIQFDFPLEILLEHQHDLILMP